jgi:hypothetical protein
MIGEATIITAEAVMTDEPDEEDWRSAKHIPVLVMQMAETSTGRSSQIIHSQNRLRLGLRWNSSTKWSTRCEWKEMNERSSNTGGASIKFWRRRRGLQKRSFPLEPAFTTRNVRNKEKGRCNHGLHIRVGCYRPQKTEKKALKCG